MKSKEFMLGIATSNFNGAVLDYFRCSKCKKIFDIGDNVHTKMDELNYKLCDKCFEENLE